MQGDAGFRYWAFLSYSHADEAFAKRLHLSLERYTLPRRLRRAHALPRRLIPVFRDVEELEAAHGLTERLQSALDQSRWLVVLCSPAAAKSKYVNGEIEYFIGKHSAKRVLCALVEGDPADSFPPAIKALSDEPLAADFRRGRDFELGLLKLIAAMAVVGFTELRNREAQRRRRRRTAIAAIAVAAAVGAMGYWDLFQRMHVDYYANYVRRNGVWEGIDPVSAEAASHRTAPYRFTRRGRLNPPDRVDYVNGSGTCAADGLEDVLGQQRRFDYAVPHNRYCAATFEYSRDGSIKAETLLNGLGKVNFTFAYTTPDLAQLTQEGFAQSSEGSGINYVQFERDRSGFDRQIRFLYARGVPRATPRHEYGFAFTRDAEGREQTRQSLDDQGHPNGDVVRTSYTPMGDLAELRYEDAAGALRISANGNAIERFQRDSAGRLVRDEYLSADGKPTLTLRHYASLTQSYDDRGNLVESCAFDDAGQPVAVGIQCERYRYDDHGWPVWDATFLHDGSPQVIDGRAANRYAYDAVGNLTESCNLDEHGQLMEDRFGIACERATHDERGNVVTDTFHGVDDKPALTNYGFEIRHTLNLRDQYLEFSFYDAEGKPFLRPDVGFAQALFERDDRGNLEEVRYLGADLKPIMSRKFGIAFRKDTHDDLGNLVEKRGFDVNHRLCKDNEGVAIHRFEYDRLGRAIFETYFDEQDRPTLHHEGYYGAHTEYDHRGREWRKTWLDAERKPMAVARRGGAGVQYEYDTLGRVQSETYLDVSGAPLRVGAVQRMDYVRDNFGEEIARRYYGPDKTLAASPATGCAVESRGFDHGRLVLEQCLDAHEHLRNRIGDGWAQKVTTYDHGRIDQVRYLDAGGKPVKPPT